MAEFTFKDAYGGTLGVWEPITGTTGDAYPATAQGEWKEAYQFRHKTLYVANTHTTHSLVFKVVLVPFPDSQDTWILQEDFTLPAGRGAIVEIPEAVYEVKVFLKSKTAGAGATFSLQPASMPRGF